MRVLTPLLLVACWLSGIESFTGLAPLRTVQRQASSRPCFIPAAPLSTRDHGTHPGMRPRRVMMAAKPPAALAQEERVDPTVVEEALIEEDKNV